MQGGSANQEAVAPAPVRKTIASPPINPFFQFINVTPPQQIPLRIFELCSKKGLRFPEKFIFSLLRTSDKYQRMCHRHIWMHFGMEDPL